MTALAQYQRLESGALWRAQPDAQRRDVTVSFGDATLVISDPAGRPLTHWSLPAVIRTNPGTRPAIFAPDAEETETLEIDDPLMIDAIETVRKTILKARPRPGRLRYISRTLAVIALAAVGFVWLPGALYQQTLSVVPQSKRSEIGATILGHLQAATGPTCRGRLGQAAINRLTPRLFGRDAQVQIVVVPAPLRSAIALPGGLILIDAGLITGTDDPAVPAGFLLAAQATRSARDPLEPVLTHAGLQTTLELLTTGEITSPVLRSYAQSLLEGPHQVLDAPALLTHFDAAKVPSSPYGRARAVLDQAVDALITEDPMAGQIGPEILDDLSWVSLQGICDT